MNQEQLQLLVEKLDPAQPKEVSLEETGGNTHSLTLFPITPCLFRYRITLAQVSN